MVVQKPYYTNGTEASLNCSADGYPPPTIVWRRHEKPKANKSMLHFQNFLTSDAGVHQCRAENVVGVKQINVSVNVTCKSFVTLYISLFSNHVYNIQCFDAGFRGISIELTQDSAVTITILASTKAVDTVHAFEQ